MSIEQIVARAVLRAEGYFELGEVASVSYPETGHEFCASVEEESFWFEHRNRAILSVISRFPPPGGYPLLDVGAGNGFVAAALQSSGLSVVAIEPGLEGVQQALRRGVRFVVHGALPSPHVRPGSAGAIGLFDVIEHIPEAERWLRELRAMLIPRGHLYITVPAYAWLWSAVDEESGHYRRYTLRQLAGVVRQAGFEIDYATYFFAPLPVPMLALRVLGGRRPASRIEHTGGGAVVRRLMRGSLGWEAWMIRRGIRIPFGSSCLLAARVARYSADDRDV